MCRLSFLYYETMLCSLGSCPLEIFLLDWPLFKHFLAQISTVCMHHRPVNGTLTPFRQYYSCSLLGYRGVRAHKSSINCGWCYRVCWHFYSWNRSGNCVPIYMVCTARPPYVCRFPARCQCRGCGPHIHGGLPLMDNWVS